MHGAVKRKVKSLLKKVVPKQYQAQLLDLYSCSRYFGSEYECLFCGGHFRKLLPCGRNLPVLKEKQVVGGGYRLARCPRFSCQSSDRERLLYFYLKNKTNIFSEKVKLLHVAPEKNLRQVLIERSNIDYLSADLCSPTGMLKLDITDIHYEDCAFDVIICNHVLEHIPDDRKAMSELYRVLRPDGWAILQVPISLAITETYEDTKLTTPEEREKAFGQCNHVRIYARDYKDRLASVGFSVEVSQFVKELAGTTIHKYALPRHEDLYIGSKLKDRS